jgi:hypothetical protein
MRGRPQHFGDATVRELGKVYQSLKFNSIIIAGISSLFPQSGGRQRWRRPGPRMRRRTGDELAEQYRRTGKLPASSTIIIKTCSFFRTVPASSESLMGRRGSSPGPSLLRSSVVVVHRRIEKIVSSTRIRLTPTRGTTKYSTPYSKR